MTESMRKVLIKSPVEASAPCRIDMGGTLDISTFYYPLRHLSPCTVNIAMDLRTRVKLLPYDTGQIKISSKGFRSAEYPLDQAPFDHPLGLMFAIGVYFRGSGVQIHIESSSPPRSGLGGSSAAAVALINAFSKVLREMGQGVPSRKNIALLAQKLEASVAGVPCGLQDQLAAAYGGANIWYWPANDNDPFFRKKTIIRKQHLREFEQHLLLGYCGIPHESKQVNRKWVQQFLSGKYRGLWKEIVVCTQKFARALMEGNVTDASILMNRETALRKEMTPEVLDEIGTALVESALENGCGARFTGAGGGGCIWALGPVEEVGQLKGRWERILKTKKGACLLDAKIDPNGLL